MTEMLRPRNGPVITLGGLHGVGKSTHGRNLAEAFGLRYVSTGSIFREVAQERGVTVVELSDLSSRDPALDLMIDEMSRRTISEGGVLFDSLLASYFARAYESFRIYLYAPLKVRMERIAARDGKREAETRLETLAREQTELERFKRYYGIDISDTSVYHLALDTSLFTVETNLKILSEAVACYLEERWSDNVRDERGPDLREDKG